MPHKKLDWEAPDEPKRLIWHGTNIQWKELPNGRKVFVKTPHSRDKVEYIEVRPPAPAPKPFPRLVRRPIPKIGTPLPKEAGYVYLVAFNGLHKIGMTCNLKSRMYALNRHWRMNNEYTIVHTIHSPDMIYLEARLHERFAAQNVHSEWFNLTPADVAWIVGLGSELNEMEIMLLAL